MPTSLYFRLYHHFIDYRFLKVFGCACYPHLIAECLIFSILLSFYGFYLGYILNLLSSFVYYKFWCYLFFYLISSIPPQIDRTGRIPMLRLRDRESYVRNKTKEYDDIAMKYLFYVLFLLVAGFSVYSLMYERHKSWYSWILSSLTSCVYMFGKQSSNSVKLSSCFGVTLSFVTVTIKIDSG